MQRREVLKAAVWGGALTMAGAGRALAEMHYPVEVEESLWKGINRVENPGSKTGLEKLHSPVIKVPKKIKADEVFPVEIAIGQVPHPMGPTHWIEYLQLNIGNEPAANVIFRSHGYAKANAKFDAVVGNELKGKTVSLIVQIKCNLHGIWQNHVNVKVV